MTSTWEPCPMAGSILVLLRCLHRREGRSSTKILRARSHGEGNRRSRQSPTRGWLRVFLRSRAASGGLLCCHHDYAPTVASGFCGSSRLTTAASRTFAARTLDGSSACPKYPRPAPSVVTTNIATTTTPKRTSFLLSYRLYGFIV